MDIRLKLSFADPEPVCYPPALKPQQKETPRHTSAADPHRVEEEQSDREPLQ